MLLDGASGRVCGVFSSILEVFMSVFECIFVYVFVCICVHVGGRLVYVPAPPLTLRQIVRRRIVKPDPATSLITIFVFAYAAYCIAELLELYVPRDTGSVLVQRTIFRLFCCCCRCCHVNGHPPHTYVGHRR